MHLHTFRERFGDLAEQARNEDASFEAYLLALCEEESRERRLNRIERLVRESRLPREKTRRALDLKRMDRKVGLQVHALVQGDFIDRRENVLALGNPGSAKTRLLCGIGHELIQGGRRVYFTTCHLLVQHDRDEMEVLLTLFAERYERGSILLRSNPFSPGAG